MEFPKKLTDNNLGIGDAYSWRKQDALEAIDFLEESGRPVVGVEYMRQEGSASKVLDYSTYDTNLGNYSETPVEDRPRYIKMFCKLAREFINAKEPTTAEFFILTWLDPEDFTRP